jgi:hypothetical protein
MAVEIAKTRARFEVKAELKLIDDEWVEVKLATRLFDHPWEKLSKGMVIARQFSGADGATEARELYGITALRRVLQDDGAVVLQLEPLDHRAGKGADMWYYWAHMTAPLSVAMRFRGDGTVAVLGL